MIKVTGLWKQQDKNGVTYFSGNFGDARVLIFVNRYKDKPNQPDYIMYLADRNGKPKQEDDSVAKAQELFGDAIEIEDDQLPF
jgi:PhoPQ-activated pathogenicity-related protein